MEMLIIGTGCALGYLLNKNGKQSRNLNKTVIVTPNKSPSGPLIYESHRLEDVDQYIRNLAAKKHADKVHQQFPSDYDKPNNIVPNDLQSDQPAFISNLTGGENYAAFASLSAQPINSSRKQFATNVAQARSTNLNVTAYDPQTGRPLIPTTNGNVDAAPMFRPAAFATLTPEFGGPISLLTGAPLDMTHANMQPMFGSSVKQVGVNNENPLVRLERFTGIPSVEDQGTYRTKHEVENAFPSNPESPWKARMEQVPDLYERAEWSVKPSHAYQSPVKSFRDLPMKDTVRMLPASIDQQRGVLNKQETYEGIMIPGQKGSKRPMMPTLKVNPWELTSYNDGSNFVPNRSTANAGTITAVPSVRTNNATTEYDNEYLAPPTHPKKITNLGAQEQTYLAQMNETVSRRIEPFSPGYGGAKGGNKAPNTGVFMVKDPDKGYLTDRMGQPYQNIGPTWNNVEAPDVTYKEMLTENKVGAINPTGLKDNRAWKDANIQLDMTTKAMNEENKYLGQAHKGDLGMGVRKQQIQLDPTLKQTTEYSYTGNPTSHIPAHMSYEAVFENDYNIEADGERYGIAKGRISKEADLGEITPDAEKLLLKDYMTNPTGPSQGMNREQFVEGLTMDYDKLDFGGYFHNAKYGNGDDAKRRGEVQLKEELSVPGRMNAPLRRDNPNDGRMEMEATLKEEQTTVERLTMNRKQPMEDVVGFAPPLIRTRNVETMNPRLDKSVKITNDLYPWIKDKGTPEDTQKGVTTM